MGWNPPPANWVKLNADGSCLSTTGEIGAGGIIRNSEGQWIKGFPHFIGLVGVQFPPRTGVG
ncbi:ribonuclease H [Senna tora]|uniref:Ribonuclease H n=1 Tax=Senna tora TaxID=362788 RepID=A0A834T5U8_9FABA|nr:ribonuclease H [Senna tora]